MVASLVTLYKKLKFVTDENVGWGPIDLPEIELQTTAYWLTAEGAGAGWRRDELDVALIGAGRAIQAVAAVLLMVDPRDLGLVAQVRSPHHEAPTIYLYEAMPGGVGLSERLFERHEELVAGAADLIRACPVRRGLPGMHWAAARARGGRQGAGAAAARGAGRRGGAGDGTGRRRMTADALAGVTRERRLANLRATLGRAGGPPVGPDQPPSRAPFAGRQSPALAARLAAALGAEVAVSPAGRLVRRVVAPVPIPIDRERLARLPGQPPPDAPLVFLDTETTGLATAAGTLAFLVGLARWDRGLFHQVQLLLPDHADEPALLAEIEARVSPDAWLVSYNGRGFDWPLIEARYRLAGRSAPPHAGHLDLLPFVRRVFRHRMADARLQSVETELLGVSRIGDVAGWEIPGIYLDVLRGGAVDALAGVVVHNEKDVRSLGLLLGQIERGYADRRTRLGAPRGDLAGLARAYGTERRHDEALACLDDALASPGPARDPFGRSPLAPAIAREADEAQRDPWWAPRNRPHFGGRPPGAGWRGELANGRGGPLGPAPTRGAWDAGVRWTDERLAAERARVLWRLGRWAESAEAWETAAAAGGALGAIAWIEVAKLREHRLDDPRGALVATRAAAAVLERSRLLGRPHARLEADLARRAVRLVRRLRRGGTGDRAGGVVTAACPRALPAARGQPR